MNQFSILSVHAICNQLRCTNRSTSQHASRCPYNSCLSIYIALFKHRLTKDDFISYTDNLLLIKIFPETTSEPIHRNKGYPKLASGFLICRHTINMTSLADDILIVITRFQQKTSQKFDQNVIRFAKADGIFFLVTKKQMVNSCSLLSIKSTHRPKWFSMRDLYIFSDRKSMCFVFPL